MLITFTLKIGKPLDQEARREYSLWLKGTYTSLVKQIGTESNIVYLQFCWLQNFVILSTEMMRSATGPDKDPKIIGARPRSEEHEDTQCIALSKRPAVVTSNSGY